MRKITLGFVLTALLMPPTASYADETLMIICSIPTEAEAVDVLNFPYSATSPQAHWTAVADLTFVELVAGRNGLRCKWTGRPSRNGQVHGSNLPFETAAKGRLGLDAATMQAELREIREELAKRITNVESRLIDRLNRLSLERRSGTENTNR